MTKKEVEDLQDQLFKIMAKEIDAGNRHKAVEVAISCYFLSKGFGSKAEEMAVSRLYTAFAAFLEHPIIDVSKLECSFCGKSGENVRLGAGPHGYICKECVSIFAEEFKSDLK